MAATGNEADQESQKDLGSPRLADGVGKGSIVGYGAISLGMFAADILINMYFLQFLLDYGGLQPVLAGFVLSAGEGMELIASFAVGVLSDKTKSRMGRRRPWILAGTLLLPPVLLLSFWVPPFGEAGKAVYYFAACMLYNAVFSVVNIPHQALAPDFTIDHNKRMYLSTSRSIFTFTGMLTMVIYAFCIVSFVFPLVPELQTEQYLIVAAYPAGMILIFGVLLVILSRNVSTASSDTESATDSLVPSGMCKSFGQLLRMRAFVLVVLFFTLVGTVVGVVSSLLPLYIVYSIGFPLHRFTEVTICIMAAMVLTILFVTKFGSRFEKRTLFNFGAILSALTYVGFYFCPGVDDTDPDVLRYGVYVMGIFSGVGQALTYTIPNAMMSDVTDLALLRTKRKQEGLMFSTMEIVQSFLQASVMWIIGLLLDVAGYDTTMQGPQPQSVRLMIRHLFCFFPVAAFGVVWILSFFYPVTHKVHKEVISKLKAERYMSTRFQSASSFNLTSKSMVTMALVPPGKLNEEGEKLVDSAAGTPFSSPEVERAPIGLDDMDESGND